MISRKTIISLAVAALVIMTVVGTSRSNGWAGRTRTPDVAPPSSLLARELAVAELQGVAEGIGHVRGSPDAPVIVIEFSDFGCPYCGMFALGTYPTLHQEYVETGKVKWHYIPFVMGMFPNGAEATRAAECAAEQGEEAFWAMHDLLYERQTGWKSARDPETLFRKYAAELELDDARFTSCYKEDRVRDRMQASNALAARAGVRATPTFFVNGRPIQGALPLDHFRLLLEASGAR